MVHPQRCFDLFVLFRLLTVDPPFTCTLAVVRKVMPLLFLLVCLHMSTHMFLGVMTLDGTLVFLFGCFGCFAPIVVTKITNMLLLYLV